MGYAEHTQLDDDTPIPISCVYKLFHSLQNVSKISMQISFHFLCLSKWDDGADIFETMVLSMLTLWVFTFNLIICESGERVTNQFEQFGVEFDRCKWNNLPIGMQRMLLVFLSDTQQSKNVQSYGGIKYTRETFKQVPLLM